MRTMTIFIFFALFVFFRPAAYSQDNYGLKFDGVYDMVTLPKNIISTPAAITIEARVKYRSSTGSMLVLSLEGAYGFYLNRRDPGTFTPFFDNPTSDNSNDVGYGRDLNNNQWHHLAAVHANGVTKIFVDGVMVGSANESLYDINSLDRISAIGAQFDGRSSNFDSIVDEVRVWSIVRTADQIQANMNRRLAGTEPGLIGYWHLDEGEGQIVHDISTKANHGYLGNLLEADPADPTWVSTIEANYALSFDGVNDVVRIPPLDFPSFTFECWVNIATSGRTHQLITYFVPATKGTVDVVVYSFTVRSDEKLRIFFQNGTVIQELIGQTRLELGKFYHVAATFDEKTKALTLYLNGEIDAGPTIINGSRPPGASHVHVDIGARAHGVIDEFRMWKIVRSQHEIRKAMRVYLQGNEPGLAGYWRFDEGEGQEVFDLSLYRNHGYLGGSPNITSSDPTWVLSTVGEGLCNGIALPATEAYGRINSSNQSHPDKVAYCFLDQPGHKLLSFQAYDIDTQDEVAVLLNGTKVFDVPLTANNSWSGLLGVLLPDELIHDHYEDNELIFDNTKNPPQSLLWGVRQVSVEPFFALPSAAAYGKIPGGDKAHADKVVYFFDGQPDDLNLIYEVYDIDNLNELDILLNGAKIRDETPTADNTWNKPRTLRLPDALVNDAGLNVLIFDSPSNPPPQWYWGVRNVHVEAAPQASVALNLSQSLIAEANRAQDGQFLFDGRITPPARSETDNSAAIDGATTIAPNGYLVVDFQTVRQFDYLQLYPEWNAQRYFTYRIDASPNGKDWQTVIDKSASFVHGIQLDELPTTQARFLRIRGASFIADVDTLATAELTEASYWQTHDDLINRADSTDLAIAELVLFQKQSLVNVASDANSLPTSYDLAQNFPNPVSQIPRFAGNPVTTIKFALPRPAKVKLAVYDLRGAIVRVLEERELPAGFHARTFDTAGLASGIYLYQLQAGEFTATRKMVLAK